MNDTKPWYTSLTIWGASILGFLVFILPLFGRPEAATAVEASKTDILGLLDKVGEVIALGMVIYGRFRASSKITPPVSSTPVNPPVN
jgi:hypothetical protein